MALTTITCRIDSADKARFDSVCRDMGLNSSTAVNMFVKAVLREGGIPFDIVFDGSISSRKHFSRRESEIMEKLFSQLLEWNISPDTGIEETGEEYLDWNTGAYKQK